MGIKKLLYTINFGGYDKARPPKIKTPGWDYVMVTDNPSLKVKGWDMLHFESKHPMWLQAREVYIKHNMLFGDYGLSIMCGGQYEVNVDLDLFLEGKMSKSADMAIAQHPARLCIYREIDACVHHLKISPEKANEIRKKYKQEGVPKEFGQVQCGVIIRKHDRHNLDRFSRLWFEETKFTTRDQLSFMYVYWKERLISFDLFSTQELDRRFIHNWHKHEEPRR